MFNYEAQYAAVCTSDFGQDNPKSSGMGPVPAAFPIYLSPDLRHWRFRGYILSRGRFPSQALPATGDWPGGEYWAPEVHRIGSYWVAYYAAQLRDATRRMALFVSWARDLLGGAWHSKLLYADAANGVIDPSVAYVGGQLDLVAAQQPNDIWMTTLSSNGLNVTGPLTSILKPNLSWEGACIEGPVLWPHGGVENVFYNANSTWDDTYSIGLASLDQSTGQWVKGASPLLRSGNGLVSTGIGAQPFRGPGGRLMLAFHVQIGSAVHAMEGRYLAFAPLEVGSDGSLFVAGAVAPTYFP